MRGLIAILLALWLAPAWAQVPMTGAGLAKPTAAGGGVSVKEVGTTAYQATSNSFNKTPINNTATSNAALVCVFIRAHATNDVEAGMAMTWNGTSMTLLKSQPTTTTVKAVGIFGLRSPATGSNTLAASATNVATDNFVNCVSFEGVNITSDGTAFPNTAGATAPSPGQVSVTSASGHIAVGAGETTGSIGTILGTTVINNNTSGSIINAMADYVVSSGASTTVGVASSQLTPIAGVDVAN